MYMRIILNCHKQVVMAYFKVLCHHSPGGFEEYHKNPQFGQPIFQQRLKSVPPWIWSNSANSCTSVFSFWRYYV